MIREIVSDQFRLSQKSLPATKEDLPVVQDLLDTIIAHATGCVGMAANMIGINKNIIIVNDDGNYLVMLNPEIIKTMGRLYETEEGCLSHTFAYHSMLQHIGNNIRQIFLSISILPTLI